MASSQPAKTLKFEAFALVVIGVLGYMAWQLVWIGLSIRHPNDTVAVPKPEPPHNKRQLVKREPEPEPTALRDMYSLQQDAEVHSPEEYSPTGYKYSDPDPCAGHHRPEDGFKGPEWMQLCEDNDVSFEDCERFLEYSWSVGDGSITPIFELPPGCIP